jgi:hypothetical protein
MWSHLYRYTVNDGIRVATMQLIKHMLSPVYIAGHRVLTSRVVQLAIHYHC